MAGEGEFDENNVDEGGMTGPGAPTPLSALEVGHPVRLNGVMDVLTRFRASPDSRSATFN
jgi:hypothetical protein